MKITLIQPEILRGNIENNVRVTQKLINNSKGDLLILPEYRLTGSLVLDNKANIQEWCNNSDKAKLTLKIPDNKILIINLIKKQGDRYYNVCELLPTDKYQIKVYRDETEISNGIISGEIHETFDLSGKKFKILICMDFRFVENISSNNLDFFIWIYHFTQENYSRMLSLLKDRVRKKKIPILASSLVSDKNCGHSTSIDNNTVISLSNFEGLLEIEL